MSTKNPHPHVSWRDGRPRFQPSKTLRAAGHEGRDLKHEDGSWFSKGEAVDWSIAFQKELAAKAKEAAKAQPKRRVTVAGGVQRAPKIGVTVGRLYEDWKHPQTGALKWRDEEDEGAGKKAYSPRTKRDIKQKMGLLEKDHPDIWTSPVDALTQPVLFGMYEELVSARGLSQARSAIAWLSVMFSWARKRGKVTFKLNQGQNPAKELGMETPPPRIRFATRKEIDALIAAADELKLPEVGDMIMLGLWTGQRQGDRLLLEDKGTLNARRIFRQSKTNAIVAIREAPELTARLKGAADRRRTAGVVSPQVVLDEERWEPFNEDGWRYRKQFTKVRELAGKKVPSLLGKGGKDALPFFEADLRDTAVTWLALAGATVPEICAITGHELGSATRILKHYLARHPEMADAGIGKMIEWFDGKGETEIGL